MSPATTGSASVWGPGVIPPGSESRLPVVDGIRGLGVLLVMQYHFWGLSFGLLGWERAAGRIDTLFSQIRILAG